MTGNAECAVHTMTMQKIDTVITEVKTIDLRLGKMETKMATVYERLENTKSLVWLMVASILTGVIGIIIGLIK